MRPQLRLVLLICLAVVTSVGVVYAIVGWDRPEQVSSYRNTTFEYSIDYPSAWRTVEVKEESRTRWFWVHDRAAPEGLAADITCSPNPKGLSPEAAWKAAQGAFPEQAVGTVVLPSGVQAFKAKGAGEQSYSVYAVTSRVAICHIAVYDGVPDKSKAEADFLNTFEWK